MHFLPLLLPLALLTPSTLSAPTEATTDEMARGCACLRPCYWSHWAYCNSCGKMTDSSCVIPPYPHSTGSRIGEVTTGRRAGETRKRGRCADTSRAQAAVPVSHQSVLRMCLLGAWQICRWSSLICPVVSQGRESLRRKSRPIQEATHGNNKNKHPQLPSTLRPSSSTFPGPCDRRSVYFPHGFKHPPLPPLSCAASTPVLRIPLGASHPPSIREAATAIRHAAAPCQTCGCAHHQPSLVPFDPLSTLGLTRIASPSPHPHAVLSAPIPARTTCASLPSRELGRNGWEGRLEAGGWRLACRSWRITVPATSQHHHVYTTSLTTSSPQGKKRVTTPDASPPQCPPPPPPRNELPPPLPRRTSRPLPHPAPQQHHSPLLRKPDLQQPHGRGPGPPQPQRLRSRVSQAVLRLRVLQRLRRADGQGTREPAPDTRVAEVRFSAQLDPAQMTPGTHIPSHPIAPHHPIQGITIPLRETEVAPHQQPNVTSYPPAISPTL
ncbi:unnamed protein product [Diplocarpon coronariae]